MAYNFKVLEVQGWTLSTSVWNMPQPCNLNQKNFLDNKDLFSQIGRECDNAERREENRYSDWLVKDYNSILFDYTKIL